MIFFWLSSVVYSTSYATLRHWSGSILAQVMACCLTASSHYVNQCWLFINDFSWHSYKGDFTTNSQNIYPWYEIHPFTIIFAWPLLSQILYLLKLVWIISSSKILDRNGILKCDYLEMVCRLWYVRTRNCNYAVVVFAYLIFTWYSFRHDNSDS